MNQLRHLPVVVLFAAVLALAVLHLRLERRLDGLSVQIAGWSANTAAPAEASAGTEEARRQTERLLLNLANAEARFHTLTSQLARVTPPVTRNSERQLLGPRRLGSDPAVIMTDEPVTADPNSPARRSWGPEQAEGAPDTLLAGDLPTAWASRQPDGGDEWLELDYDQEVEVAQVRIRETYNPGAISRIEATLPDGSTSTLWEGIEPASVAPVEMEFSFHQPVRSRRIRIHLDTRRVAGWNEIDAAELIGRDGTRQWARRATASSSFADR